MDMNYIILEGKLLKIFKLFYKNFLFLSLLLINSNIKKKNCGYKM